MSQLKLVALCKTSKELLALESFLIWQDANFTVEEDMEVLRLTEGKNITILIKNDLVVGKGFKEIIDYYYEVEKVLV